MTSHSYRKQRVTRPGSHRSRCLATYRALVGRSSAVVLGGLILGSCANLADPFVVDSAVVTDENPAVAVKPDPINLDHFFFPDEADEDDKTAYRRAVGVAIAAT